MLRQDYKWALMTIEIYSKLYNFVANEINIIREDLFLYFDEIHELKLFNLLIQSILYDFSNVMLRQNYKS